MTAMDGAHALVVGIAGYDDVPPLPPTVVKDAQDVYDVLVDPSIGGYRRDNVTLLLDEQATRRALLEKLDDLASRTDRDSTVLLFLSCHGARAGEDASVQEYLLPVDTRRADLPGSAISGTRFSEAVAAIPARKVVVLFDCCHAAGIGDVKAADAPVLKAGLPESYYDALAAGRGRAILASSRETEYSWVLPGADNSLFTAHLLAGLAGGAVAGDGLVRVFQLFEYLQPRITRDKPDQHPVFKAVLEENFPVALRLGGQKSDVPTVEDGFLYDAYVSFVDEGADRAWVRSTLLPHLEREGVKVAISEDVEEPGVERVVNLERGIEGAKRTVLVLSPAYLADNWAQLESTMGDTLGIEEGSYRLLPLSFAELDDDALPLRLKRLSRLDLSDPLRAERGLERLVGYVKGPLPRRRP